MTHSFLTHLECPRCGRTCDAGRAAGLCACGSPLLARYDLAAARTAISQAALGRSDDPLRPAG